MKIEKVTDLQYANAEHTQVNLRVKFEHADEVFPFTTSMHDLEMHGIELYTESMAGTYGPISVYTPPVIDPALKLKSDLALVGLCDDLENIIDAMDEVTQARISTQTMDKYRAKKTLKNQG